MGNKQFTATGHPAPPPATAKPFSACWPSASGNTDAAARTRSNIISLCGIGVILFLLFFYYYIPFDPLHPKYPHFRVESLSLSDFNVSSFTISGNWTASFTVANPNKKMKISYKDLNADAYYHHVMVATANLTAPSHQEAKSTADISLPFAATSPFVDGPVYDRIIYDRSRGSFEFDIRIYAHATIRGWFDWHEYLMTRCKHLVVDVSSNFTDGELIGGPIHCSETSLMSEFID